MAKRVVASSLGIHRKKQLKKQPTSRKKRFLRKALRYLCSDTFMYAPFAAAAASSDDGFITTTAAAATTSASLPPLFPTGEGKKLIDKVGDYLKSDFFMYAPLTNHFTQTPPPPPQGPTWLDKRSPSKEIDQSTERRVTKGDKVTDNPRYRRSTRFQQTREHHETVNYIVQQNCRPIPGEGILGQERRNLVGGVSQGK